MRQSLPVNVKTMVWQDRGLSIYFPQIIRYHNKDIARKINEQIEEAVHQLISEQVTQQGTSYFAEMIGQYEIKTNERNVFSIVLSNYAIFEHAAHGLTLLKGLTFDMETGEAALLESLFAPNADYIRRLNELVAMQIEERDIPLLAPFTSIAPNQDYYLADKALVLFFQLYELAPYYIGLPMFPISVYALEDILREEGLLERMLP